VEAIKDKMGLISCLGRGDMKGAEKSLTEMTEELNKIPGVKCTTSIIFEKGGEDE